MLSIADMLLFAGLGITAGTLAGLFGLGGGTLIVPGLFYLFSLMDLPEESLIHVAAATSMGIMICTSTASTVAHQLKGHIQWSFFQRIGISIIIGVICGNLLSRNISANLLELIFGIFLLIVSLKILLDFKPDGTEKRIPSFLITSLIGFVIGFKSGVLGVGGGTLSVPFLLYCGLPMKEASGTSASFTLPIAIIGTMAFLLLGDTQTTIPWSTGYIYWPAIALVAPFTMLGAPIGARLSQVISAQKLRRFFALLLLCLSARMLAGTSLWLWH